MITGNHDTNCLVPGSLDLLTPLISEHRALAPPNLTYWRSSGVYIAHNMIWSVIATDGQPPISEAECKLRDEYPTYPHICLFHEEVNGGRFSNGMKMEDFKLGLTSFDKYDLTMGGHIHLRQRLTQRAGYCGSLIQQNIGESHTEHGYLLWELSCSTAVCNYRTEVPTMTGINILNDMGYLRVLIDANGNDRTLLPIPTRPIFWEACAFDNYSEVVLRYTEQFGMQPRAIRCRTNENKLEPATDSKDTLWEAQLSSRSIASHEDIIRELLGNLPISESVISLHHEYMGNSINQQSQSGGKFRILRMEFDNMYAFGPANVVDFTMLEGCVSGVVAPNHTGKSSLSETLLFALYDEHPRAPHKKDVVHRGAKSCRIVLDFELDGKKGRIIKGLDSVSNQRVSQYRFEYAGESRTKGGTAETVAEIRTVLGSASTALASSFQLQGGESGGFISATPAGRKKLIADVLSLGSFESAERKIVKVINEASGELKMIQGQFRGNTVDKLHEMIGNEHSKLSILKADTAIVLAIMNDRQEKLQVANQQLGSATGN